MKRYDEITQSEIDKEIDKLANRLKKLRQDKGYSSHENFAYEHGIPRAQYGRYEKHSDLRFSSLVRIAKVHGLSLEELFEGL